MGDEPSRRVVSDFRFCFGDFSFAVGINELEPELLCGLILVVI